MLFAWLTICLMVLIWLCAFVALATSAPILLTARRERWFRRLRRSLQRSCETLWWLGPRPLTISLPRSAENEQPRRPARLSRRRAA
jgi:hypothetical protein